MPYPLSPLPFLFTKQFQVPNGTLKKIHKQPGLVAHTFNLSTPKTMDQKFKAIFGYIESLRTFWSTLDNVSKREVEHKEN